MSQQLCLQYGLLQEVPPGCGICRGKRYTNTYSPHNLDNFSWISLSIGKLYCENCYGTYLAPDCSKCRRKIIGVRKCISLLSSNSPLIKTFKAKCAYQRMGSQMAVKCWYAAIFIRPDIWAWGMMDASNILFCCCIYYSCLKWQFLQTMLQLRHLFSWLFANKISLYCLIFCIAYFTFSYFSILMICLTIEEICCYPSAE